MRPFPNKPLEGFSVRAVLWAASLLAVMGLITGCSSKCEAVCSEANACAVNERAVDVDCPEYCADVDNFNARAVKAGAQSCDAQFQAHLSCWETNSKSICDATYKGCEEAQTAFAECMTTYCEAVAAAQEEDPKVYDPNCVDGEPTLAPF